MIIFNAASSSTPCRDRETERENFIFLMRFSNEHNQADLSSGFPARNESNKRKTGNKRENKTWKSSSTFLFTTIFLPGGPSIRKKKKKDFNTFCAFVRHRFLAKFSAISSVGKRQKQRGNANRTRIVYAIHSAEDSFVTEDFVLELISVESYGRVKVNWSFGLIVPFQIVFLIRIFVRM